MTTPNFDTLDESTKLRIQKYINLGIQKDDIASMIQGWNLGDQEELAQTSSSLALLQDRI